MNLVWPCVQIIFVDLENGFAFEAGMALADWFGIGVGTACVASY